MNSPTLPDADSALRRLVIEAAFAAVQHGWRQEIRQIEAALNDWLDDAELLAACRAILLFGLGQPQQAARQLAGQNPQLCAPLRALLPVIDHQGASHDH